MNAVESSEDRCIVCGKDLTNTPGTTHLYHEGRSFSLCCPMCVEMFQRAPERFSSGERPQTILEELLAEMKWKTPGSP